MYWVRKMTTIIMKETVRGTGWHYQAHLNDNANIFSTADVPADALGELIQQNASLITTSNATNNRTLLGLEALILSDQPDLETNANGRLSIQQIAVAAFDGVLPMVKVEWAK